MGGSGQGSGVIQSRTTIADRSECIRGAECPNRMTEFGDCPKGRAIFLCPKERTNTQIFIAKGKGTYLEENVIKGRPSEGKDERKGKDDRRKKRSERRRDYRRGVK